MVTYIRCRITGVITKIDHLIADQTERPLRYKVSDMDHRSSAYRVTRTCLNSVINVLLFEK